MRKYTEREIVLAYLAGFVDGEGSICVISESKARPYVPKLAVTNTNVDVLEMFNDAFGHGKTRIRIWEKESRKENWKPCYIWSVTKRRAAEVIKELYPFLRLKKKQADIALRISRLQGKYNGAIRRWNPDINVKCIRVYGKLKTRCKALNHRGLLKVA
jgi:hypothetical protein